MTSQEFTVMDNIRISRLPMQVKQVLSLVAVLPKVHLPEKVNKPLMLGYIQGLITLSYHNRDLLLWLTGSEIPTMDRRTNGRFLSVRALSVNRHLRTAGKKQVAASKVNGAMRLVHDPQRSNNACMS